MTKNMPVSSGSSVRPMRPLRALRGRVGDFDLEMRRGAVRRDEGERDALSGVAGAAGSQQQGNRDQDGGESKTATEQVDASAPDG